MIRSVLASRRSLGGPLGSVGGGGSFWTPAQPTTDGGVLPHTWEVPGVANFQDAAKTTPAGVGDVVGAVVNQGSDTHDIVQATTANKPTLQQVTINDVTSYVWRFDGTNDYLQGAFGGGATSQPRTAFAVAKLDATAVNDDAFRYIIDGYLTQRRIIGKDRNTAPDSFAAFSGSWLDYGVADSNGNIFTVVFNGATSSIFKNGGTPVTGNTSTGSPAGITVGASTSGGSLWKGDVGEIIVYSGDLSTADKNQVGEYLERVTGITWTTIV